VDEVCKANLDRSRIVGDSFRLAQKFFGDYSPVYARMCLAQVIAEQKWIVKGRRIVIPNPYFIKPIEQPMPPVLKPKPEPIPIPTPPHICKFQQITSDTKQCDCGKEEKTNCQHWHKDRQHYGITTRIECKDCKKRLFDGACMLVPEELKRDRND
jgi:hypothetical protein